MGTEYVLRRHSLNAVRSTTAEMNKGAFALEWVLFLWVSTHREIEFVPIRNLVPATGLYFIELKKATVDPAKTDPLPPSKIIIRHSTGFPSQPAAIPGK